MFYTIRGFVLRYVLEDRHLYGRDRQDCHGGHLSAARRSLSSLLRCRYFIFDLEQKLFEANPKLRSKYRIALKERVAIIIFYVYMYTDIYSLYYIVYYRCLDFVL